METTKNVRFPIFFFFFYYRRLTRTRWDDCFNNAQATRWISKSARRPKANGSCSHPQRPKQNSRFFKHHRTYQEISAFFSLRSQDEIIATCEFLEEVPPINKALPSVLPPIHPGADLDSGLALISIQPAWPQLFTKISWTWALNSSPKLQINVFLHWTVVYWNKREWMKTIEETNETLGLMSAAVSRISRGYLLLLTGLSSLPSLPTILFHSLL